MSRSLPAIAELSFEIDFLVFEDGETAGPDSDHAVELHCRKLAAALPISSRCSGIFQPSPIFQLGPALAIVPQRAPPAVVHDDCIRLKVLIVLHKERKKLVAHDQDRLVSNWEHANDIAGIVVFIALFTNRLRNRVPSVRFVVDSHRQTLPPATITKPFAWLCRLYPFQNITARIVSLFGRRHLYAPPCNSIEVHQLLCWFVHQPQ